MHTVDIFAVCLSISSVLFFMVVLFFIAFSNRGNKRQARWTLSKEQANNLILICNLPADTYRRVVGASQVALVISIHAFPDGKNMFGIYAMKEIPDKFIVKPTGEIFVIEKSAETADTE